jgi:hypothetical protein
MCSSTGMSRLSGLLFLVLVTATLVPSGASEASETSLPAAGSPSPSDHATNGIDWEAYQILEDEVNISQSLEYLRRIPVHLYWDEHRGGFRTGVLGEKIIDTFPELVTYSLIKNATKGPISLINITTIDTNTLFMHLFLVVQWMTQKSSEIAEATQPLRRQLEDFETSLALWQNVTGEDWKTAAQLRVEYLEKEMEVETIRKRVSLTRSRTASRLAMLREYYQVGPASLTHCSPL